MPEPRSEPSLCSKSHTDHPRPAHGFPIAFRYTRSFRICAQLPLRSSIVCQSSFVHCRHKHIVVHLNNKRCHKVFINKHHMPY
uniref:Uncharacterized protein n=1 Tax=Arundo donax TaxID=35708 RepID=A0A0A9GCQ0_ARUDO